MADSASDLYNRGIPEDRISSLSENPDVDLDLHASVTRKLDVSPNNRYQTSGAADIAEVAAETRLQNCFDDVRVTSQVDFSRPSGAELEVDHVIISDRKIVGFAETKNSVAESALDEAETQLGTRRQAVRNGELVDANKLELDNYEFDIQDEYTVTAGCDGDVFDIEVASPEEVSEIESTFDEYIDS